MSQKSRQPADAVGASIARNTVFGLATQLSSAFFTAALTLYLVRALGPGDYGVFALAIGIGTVVILLSDFGITPSAERFIAEHPHDDRAVAAVLADAFKLKLAIAAGASILLAALAGSIADAYGNPALTWPLRAVAVAVFGQSMLLLYRGSYIALRRVAVTWRITVFESIVETATSVALVVAGAGAAGAAWGRAVGYVFGAALAIALTVRLFGSGTISLRARERSRKLQIVKYASALLVVTAAFTLFEQIDVLLIGAIVGTKAVGIYEAPLRLVNFLGYAGQAMAFGVAPRLARAGTTRPNVESFERGLRLLVIVQAALLAPLLVWAGPIVEVVLGSEYAGSAAVLRALAPFAFMLGIGTLVTLSVNFLGDARRRVPLAIGALVLNLVIDLILIPKIGIVGGAIGTDVAFLLYVLGHLWICKRELDFATKPFVATTLRCLIAAAIMALPLLAIGTSALSALELVGGMVVATLLYLGALWATREVSRADLSMASELLSRVYHRDTA